MTRYQRIAARAIGKRLEGQTEPVTLYTVSCWADSAASDAGKLNALFDSLFDYCDLLPSGWRTSWLTSGSGSTSMVYAVPPGWREGQSQVRTLAMDGGTLRYASAFEVG